MKPEEFVLDLPSNPHPRMLAGALAARRHARSAPKMAAFWAGYLCAMADATGCEPEELEAWLDHHEGER